MSFLTVVILPLLGGIAVYALGLWLSQRAAFGREEVHPCDH